MGKHFALTDSETGRELQKNCVCSILRSSNFTIVTRNDHIFNLVSK